MSTFAVIIYITLPILLASGQDGLDCPKSTYTYTSRGTGYYPANNPLEGGFFDCQDKQLCTLQDFLDGNAPYVSVAMDHNLKLKYGLELCIPQLNKKHNKFIIFKVTDTGSAFTNKSYSRIDICTKTNADSVDSTINGPLTLVFNKIEYGTRGKTAC